MKFNVINVIIVVRNFNPKEDQKDQKILFLKKYVHHRQTLQDLATKYNKSIQWGHYKIKEFEPQIKVHDSRAVNLICDATFYAKRKDKLGTLVFMDSIA